MAVSRPEQTFSQLNIPAPLVRLLADQGITRPTPIQALTLPDALAGRDVLGRGQTGSGKTYAFVLPLLCSLAARKTARQPGRPRALILAPTRELAAQIDASMAPLAKAVGLSTLTVFGGVGLKPQIAGLRRGVDIVVACPGRLADLIDSGHAQLSSIEITVLDEADHMADLGFLPVVRKLLAQTPRDGQRLLFSATLDSAVDALARQFMHQPVTRHVGSEESPVATMAHHVLQLRVEDKFQVLVDLTSAPGRTIVFARTKRGAKKLTHQLVSSGVPAVELHGNLAQSARNRNLEAFSSGATKTLVATDIAARGIHVDDVALVIHADPPVEHKAYLHRSGRTARAGTSGMVITLTTGDQMREVRDLTRKAGVTPTTTSVRPGDPILATLAPGQRTLVPAPAPAAPATQARTRASKQARTQAVSKQARTQAPSEQARTRTASKPAGMRSASEQPRTRAAAKPARTQAPAEQARTRAVAEQVPQRTSLKPARPRRRRRSRPAVAA